MNRERVLAETDLFLPATDRAALALRLEGVPEEKDQGRRAGHRCRSLRRARAASSAPAEDHLVVSPGRLVWEKGHQDVLRALALLEARNRAVSERCRRCSSGDHRRRPGGGATCASYARELGLEGRVEIRSAPTTRCRRCSHRVGDGARQPGRGDVRLPPARCAACVLGGAIRSGAGGGDGLRAEHHHHHQRRDSRGGVGSGGRPRRARRLAGDRPGAGQRCPQPSPRGARRLRTRAGATTTPRTPPPYGWPTPTTSCCRGPDLGARPPREGHPARRLRWCPSQTCVLRSRAAAPSSALSVSARSAERRRPRRCCGQSCGSA